MRSTRQQKKPQTRAAEVPPGTSRAPAETAAVDGPQGRPIPRDGRRIRRQVWCLHHSWRRALTQCRARYHIPAHPFGRPNRYKSLPLGTGIGLCLPLGGRRTPVSILTPLSGSGRFCRAHVWLAARTWLNDSGVDTTRRPGGSRALSSNRATLFPQPNGRLIRGSPPLQWCRDDWTCVHVHPVGSTLRHRYPCPTLRVGGGRRAHFAGALPWFLLPPSPANSLRVTAARFHA